MPPQQLSTPFRTQSLCIFCAAALELEASIGPRAWTLGRRTLKTSTTAYKPPAYATAEVEDQDRDSWDNTPLPADPSSGSWGKPSSTSSWASNSFTVKLSPEEQRQKQASAQHTVPVHPREPTPRQYPATQHHHTSISRTPREQRPLIRQQLSSTSYHLTNTPSSVDSNYPSYRRSRFTGDEVQQPKHAQVEPGPAKSATTSQGTWQCSSCGRSNRLSRSKCISCLQPRQPTLSMPKWNDSVTKSWSHLQTSYPSQKKLSEVLLDRQKQQDREQQSKQGDYIPLTAQSGEPKPSRSWEDWGNAVDETMARTFNPSGEVYTQPFVATEEKVGYAEAKENSKMHNGNPWITSVPTPKLEHMPASRVAKGRQKLAETYDIDYDDYSEDRAERRRRRKNKELKKKAKAAAPTPIYLPEFISVANLATALHVSPEQFEAKLLELGFEETSYDHIVDGETAGLIAQEFSFEPRYDNQEDARDILPRPPVEDMSVLPQRPPIITIMGHVDHGKTTILDSLRKSSVVASEFGGITQHIGAFSVKMPSGKTMTFLDTPGHAAFLSMRQRGANVTDIVILVVAADDSVMPQTIEAINHAKAANVPILLAINKIDKEEADPERVKQDLAKYGVVVEDYGGDTQAVCISGKTGEGMHDLEEATMLLAEMQDMRAEQDGLAEGWIIEATTKKGGRVATVLVRRGTMRSGDVIVAGTTWGRIRTLKNEAGVEVPAAGPGTPVEVDGWKDQPVAGDEVLQAPDEQKAKSSIDYRREKASLVKLSEDTAAINEQRAEERSERDREKREKELAENEDSIEEISAQPSITETSERSGMKEVYFIVKGDVSGSVEAVVNSVCGVGNEEVRPHIIRSGVGSVTEFDIEHAATANGCILAFNVDVDPHVRSLAETSGVKILDHNIIYKLVDDVKAKLSEQLKPRITKSVLGEAEIGQIFQINLKGREFKNVAGCKVRTGLIMRNRKVKVQRGDEIVFDGSLSSLKNVKKDVLEVRRGTECGVSFEKWEDFQIGDQIQCYEEKSEKRSL